jgi:photosystem II stability/assembly factor-like uncharacterized protein
VVAYNVRYALVPFLPGALETTYTMTSRSGSRVLCFVAAVLILGLNAVALPVQEMTADGVSSAKMPELHWRMIGPFRGGRTRAAAGIPDQPNVFFIGQVNGGVWKSTDYGRTWNPIFDGQETQSVGAIAVAPSDSNVIYVASGEGLHRPDLSVGDGIYRSADGGKTWEHLGLREGQQIPALLVDPTNPDRLFAAVLGHPYGPNADRGIYRSQDGGKTWEKVLEKGDRVGGSDVVLDPKNPQTVYASMWEDTLGPWEDGNEYSGTGGGLFKSTDGGTTWKQLKNGLPENLVQINVAIAASDPQRLYATLSTMAVGGYGSGAGLGVYRSDDAGETWRKITEDPRPAMKIGGGDLAIPAVDPLNPDVVYSASIVTERSTDGGKTWMSLRGAPGGDDYQNIWINPLNPKIMLVVSDQGAIITVNGGETWGSWYNQPTAQLYHVAATNTFPYQVCAGQQESGSVCTSTRGNDGAITFREWHPAGIIEYGYAAPDPLHPEIVYGAGRTEVSRYDTVTGEVQNITPLPVRKKDFRAERTEPILFSPVDPHVMYYATNHLFKTTDYGHTWETISPDLSQEHTGQPASLAALKPEDQARRRGAIYAVAASYKNTKTIWAGSDDGLVWITRDGGAHWSNITPPGISPWSKVTQIDASRFDDDTAYMSISRFRIDDLKPYAFKTHDGGKTWVSIAAGLPDNAPADAVRADPVQAGLLFAATERAVWTSFDDGAHWTSLEYNLPHTSMRDLLIHEDDLVVATHGRSFWVLDDIAPLRELAAAKGKPEKMLLKPAAAWRVRRDNYADTPVPADEPMGENPPDGALVDYALPDGLSGPVSLEILDKGGKVIRRFTSNDPVVPSPEEMQTNLIPAYWPLVRGPLAATAGMHRWVWDLRANTPMAGRYSYPISAVPHRTPQVPQGPLVTAGTYTVRLTAGGKSETQPLTVKMDPRVKTPAAVLEALHAEQVKMADLLNEAANDDLAAHSIQEQLGKPENASIAGMAPFAAKVKALVSGGEGEKAGPGMSGPDMAGPDKAAVGLDGLAGEAGQVYGELEQADEPPTAALLEAAAHVHEEGRGVLPRWKEFVAKDLPELNRMLRGAGKPEIDLKKAPGDMPDEGDED